MKVDEQWEYRTLISAINLTARTGVGEETTPMTGRLIAGGKCETSYELIFPFI